MPWRTRRRGLEVEGPGIVYLEAAASGLPVLAGDSGGAPDAVRDGETGHVVDGRSVAGTADRLVRFLRNPGPAREMGGKGRHWVRTEWTWDQPSRRCGTCSPAGGDRPRLLGGGCRAVHRDQPGRTARPDRAVGRLVAAQMAGERVAGAGLPGCADLAQEMPAGPGVQQELRRVVGSAPPCPVRLHPVDGHAGEPGRGEDGANPVRGGPCRWRRRSARRYAPTARTPAQWVRAVGLLRCGSGQSASPVRTSTRS